MIHHLLKTKSFIPSVFYDSFFDIDFKDLKEKGIRYIISDLDNTLIPYDIDTPTPNVIDKLKELETLGFQVILLSNNKPIRINTFMKGLSIKGYANARKPLLIGINKAMKSLGYPKLDEVVLIGDQLMTDIWGANRLGVYSILVNPIKRKTEKWYTKMNRKIEEKMIEKIKNKESETYKRLKLDRRR
jgi:HAD superfamily phosphatase (TIGR01668 family)